MMQYLSTFSNAANSHFPIKLFMPHFCINLVKLIEFSLSDWKISMHFTCKVSLYVKETRWNETKKKHTTLKKRIVSIYWHFVVQYCFWEADIVHSTSGGICNVLLSYKESSGFLPLESRILEGESHWNFAFASSHKPFWSSPSPRTSISLLRLKMCDSSET